MSVEKARKLSFGHYFVLHYQRYLSVGQERGVQGSSSLRQGLGCPERVQCSAETAGENRFSILQVKGIATAASTMGNQNPALFLSPRDGKFDLNGLIRKLWSVLTGELVPMLEKVKALGIFL